MERFFSTLKQFRGIAACWDKEPEKVLAAVKLAESVRLIGGQRSPF
ncbi:hypothetical protein J0X15_09970 [Roseibium sp. CAU 1637]|uniref:Transposase n=1 Tax=Roseibium limicola TaxID=2816037 RepID=A0A939J6X0_9HYPH|nr:hypothetical protein [Roseibium limicola]